MPCIQIEPFFMTEVRETKEKVTVLFAGDSGDGMQLTGNQFTNTHALFGNDVSTFPNFPAEIRAPQGTVPGVSGFQVQFGSSNVFTAGDKADVLVVMNVAALKANLHKLKRGGVLIANESGFDKKNMKLAKVEYHPLETDELAGYSHHFIDVTGLTLASLEPFDVSRKDADRSKNMFVLGFLYWMFDRSIAGTVQYLAEKFGKRPDLVEMNEAVLKAGYNFGETSEVFTTRYEVKKAALDSGNYRNIMGNNGIAIGLVAAAQKSGLELFYGSYPITPASDILHELAKYKQFGIKTFQAEDEIAAICSAIGASFGGALGVTASSGPGIALKSEAMGLAVMLEVPLVIVNVQRGGPSTGLPTKTEQADLFQALYGRNGEAPMPVIAARQPADTFDTVFEGVRLALKYMTPVMVLSDGYIANGAEPWRYPSADELPTLEHRKVSGNHSGYQPYARDESLVRDWAIPGTPGLEHRLGGLEKDALTGDVSYDPENHEKMVEIRAEKVMNIAEDIPKLELDQGTRNDELLILGWGSTYGAIKSAVNQLRAEGLAVAHAHFRYISPLPKNTEMLLADFNHVLIPEMNKGQLVQLIRSNFLIDAVPLNKVQGVPFTAEEIQHAAKEQMGVQA